MMYFVEYLPYSCFFCDCCHTKIYSSECKIDPREFCGIKNVEVGKYFDHNKETGCRPNWCPLKEIPDDCLDKIIYNK